MSIVLSIIIPAYKAEKCLVRCMDSLLPQINDQIEVILVDDGSPDNTGGLCDRYAELCPQVLAYHTENGGVSHARNYGLSKARGEYIAFIDSDDYVEKDYLETLFQVVCDGPDLVWFDHRAVSEIAEYQNKAIPDTYVRDDRIRANVNAAILELRFNYPWDKVFKHALISGHAIRFNETMIGGEDLLFNVDVVTVCKSIKYCPKSIYVYVLNPASATHNLKLRNISNLVKLHDVLKEYHDAVCRELPLEPMYQRELALLEKMVADVVQDAPAKEIRAILKQSTLEKDIKSWKFSRPKDRIRSQLLFGGAYRTVSLYTKMIMK